MRSISPFGPILGKELRVTSRRKRSYVLRVAYLGALLLFLMLAYETSRPWVGAGVAYRTQQQARLGQVFFLCFAIFSTTAMALIGPVLTSTAVSSERLHKTLAVLLMTPINAWQIVAGKLFSRLLVALTLIGLSLPVLALVRLLGGVEIEQMAGVVCLCAAAALGSAALGLFFSTLINRTYAVILLSYAVLLFAYLFVPFATMLSGMQSGAATRVLGTINPIASATMLASGMISARQSAWVASVLVQLVAAAALVLASGTILRRKARQEGQAGPIAPTGNPTDAVASASRAVGDNPVLWRELRRPLMTRRWQRVVGILICAALLLFTYAQLANENALGDSETQIGFAWVFNAVMWMMVCVLSATAIAQEKESDTWTVLLATPLSGWAIVRGKLAGLLRRMAWPWVLVATHFLIFTFAGAINLIAMGLILWVIVTFNTLWIATGIYFSLRLKKTITAVVVNLLLPLTLYALVPLMLLILGQMIDSTDDWAEWTAWYVPYYHLGEGVSASKRPETWVAGLGQTTSSQLLRITFYVGAIYVASAAVVTAYTAARFDRIVGRATGRLTGRSVI